MSLLHSIQLSAHFKNSSRSLRSLRVCRKAIIADIGTITSCPKPTLVPSNRVSLSGLLPPPELGTVCGPGQNQLEHREWVLIFCATDLASVLAVISGADWHQTAGLFGTCLFHSDLRTVFSSPLADALCTGWCSVGQLEQGHSDRSSRLCPAPPDNADSSLEHKHQSFALFLKCPHF